MLTGRIRREARQVIILIAVCCAGKLSAHTSPSDRARILASQLSLLRSRLSDLVATPVPYDKLSNVPAVAPWATSRSAFINWAAAKKASPAATGAEGGQAAGGEGDPVVGQFQQEAEATGKADDAKVRAPNLSSRKLRSSTIPVRRLCSLRWPSRRALSLVQAVFRSDMLW